MVRRIALVQAIYYVITGIWPLIEPRSFQAMTGPKTDLWLVKTVGLLVAVIGVVIGLAGIRREGSPEIRLLVFGSALSLLAIDVFYVAKRRIAPVYLVNALAQLALVVTWRRAWSH